MSANVPELALRHTCEKVSILFNSVNIKARFCRMVVFFHYLEADPGSGTLLTPGSWIGFISDPGSPIPDPQPIFFDLSVKNFWDKSSTILLQLTLIFFVPFKNEIIKKNCEICGNKKKVGQQIFFPLFCSCCYIRQPRSEIWD